MNKKTFKQFRKLMEANGLTLEEASGGGHLAIRNKDGARVGTLATTGEMNACRQVVRFLVQQGDLPKECKRVKF